MSSQVRKPASRPDWADNPGLLVRLRNAVLVLNRGAGTYQQRMTAARLELTALPVSGFPPDLDPHFRTLQKTWSEADQRSADAGTAGSGATFSDQASKQRAAFHMALITLYEAAVGDAALIEAERARSNLLD